MSQKSLDTAGCDRITDDEKERALSMADSFTSTVISPELQEQVLEYAQSIKTAYFNEVNYWNVVNKPKQYRTPTYRQFSKTIYFKMKKIIPGLKMNGDFKRVFLLLCQYFTDNPDFEKEGYSLQKGIMIQGPVGCGKTTLLKAFAQNPKQSYMFFSCRKITYNFAVEGFKVVERFSKVETGAEDPWGKTKYGVAFDDLGTDDERKHYGDKVNVMADVILNRYDNTPNGFTHITTNLAADQIEEVYGLRVKSRMREMFNQIVFNPQSEDRRK